MKPPGWRFGPFNKEDDMLKQILRLVSGGSLGALLVISLSGFTGAGNANAACSDTCYEREDGASCCYDCETDKTTCVKIDCCEPIPQT